MAKGGLRAGAAPEPAADSAAFSGEGGRSGARDIFTLYLKVCEARKKIIIMSGQVPVKLVSRVFCSINRVSLIVRNPHNK